MSFLTGKLIWREIVNCYRMENLIWPRYTTRIKRKMYTYE